MIKKVFVMVVLLIMCFGVFNGCGNGCEEEKNYKDRVIVNIKIVYREKFLAEEFSIDDFAWNNIEKIEHVWLLDPKLFSPDDPRFSTNPIVDGYILVYLKRHSDKQVQAAIKHFETIDFIFSANTVPIIASSIY